MKKKIVLLASGRGSNVQAIADYFRTNARVELAHLICNKENAGVLEIAAKEQIPFTISSKRKDFNSEGLLQQLINIQPDLIVLAGFLWPIPDSWIQAFPNKIINIHPALLPKYGGKGMYGHFVHEAVIAHHEKESGITIHFVNEHYDEGKIIAQFTCEIDSTETAESLAQKIHLLEHHHFPKTIEQLLFEN